MTTAGAEEAIHVRDTGHLSDRDIASATGAAPRTVREWLTESLCSQRIARRALG
jgi:hypothetical protein